MAGDLLFGDVFEGGKASKRVSGDGPARVSRPDRHQSWLRPEILDELIPHNHRARAIVAAVEGLDLSAFYASIKSRGSEPGRPATDPAMLVALWLFATSEGVGSGRQLARLCERDDVYRWICGGVSVNYHTLTDFRVRQSAALDGLLAQLLAVLMHRRLVSLKRVAQDGVRVRANAGASSFRRKASLQECLVEAKQQVARAKQLLDKDDPTRLDKQQAAVARAAREREDRVTAALDELKQLQAKQSAKSDSKAKPEAKSNGKAKEPRASTTDPEARVMRMGDGGYRPAFNIQFATDTESKVIVGVGVTNNGTDYGLIAPMLEEVERRTGEQPKEWLADGGYVDLEDIQAVGESGVKVLAPVPVPRSSDIDPHCAKPNDSEHVAEWRERMGTKRAKEIYRERAATAELVNADLRTHRGLKQLPVRGTKNVLTIGLWMAVTYNVLTWISAMPGA